MAASICTGTTPSGPCSRRTLHPSGRCHHHRTAAGTVRTVPAAAHAAAAVDLGCDEPQDAAVGAAAALAYRDPDPGCPLGVTVGVADHDAFEDGVLIAQAYLDPSGPRPALHAKLTPEGEQQLVDALQVAVTKTEAVVTVESHHGRHPADVELGVGNLAGTIARSCNARAKNGEPLESIRDRNLPRVDELSVAVDKLAATPGVPEDLVVHYADQVAALQAWLGQPHSHVPYPEGRLPHLAPWEGPYETRTETEVEVESDVDLGLAVLPTRVREGARIKPTLTAAGAVWDGWDTTGVAQSVWDIDLGDGWQALYVPEQYTSGADAAFSQRRRLTVVGPPGGSCAGGMEKLRRCNLNTAPATPATMECVYLERQFAAEELLEHPAVQQARVDSAGYVAAAARVRIEERADEMPADPDAAERWVVDQLAAAQVEVAPTRARRLRDGYAAATGAWKSGDQLARSASYRPVPTVGRGTVAWERIGRPDAKKGKAQTFTHVLTSEKAGGLHRILQLGQLASQERRRMMGLSQQLGLSQAADVTSGGASATFLYVNLKSPSRKPRLVWAGEEAERLKRRADSYASTGDQFGVTNVASRYYRRDAMARTSAALDALKTGQLMVGDTVDLDAFPPSRVEVRSASERADLIAACKAEGRTTIGGRPLEDVVKVMR